MEDCIVELEGCVFFICMREVSSHKCLGRSSLNIIFFS
jgi:hypothetical protein